jgi:hypothetical protein
MEIELPLFTYTAAGQRLLIDLILRHIWFGDSSKAKYKATLFLFTGFGCKIALILVLPVPAVPDTSILLPIKNPCTAEHII